MKRPDELPPWRRSRALCDACGQKAIRFIWASELSWPNATPGAIVLGSGPVVAVAHACEDHYEDMMDDICDGFGDANSFPVRESWGRWLTRKRRGE